MASEELNIKSECYETIYLEVPSNKIEELTSEVKIEESISESSSETNFFENSPCNEDRLVFKGFQCTYCDATFDSPHHVREHQNICHTGLDPYECDICRKRLSSAQTLRDHRTIHTGDRPFKCNECNKAFPTPRQLSIHQRIHSGEQLFPCPVCDKSYRTLCGLKWHYKHHTGEKSFQCEVCLKSFALLSHLKDHAKRHSGEKPFQCCESFVDKRDLVVHERKHNGEKPYKCNECGKCFRATWSLRNHRKTHADSQSANPKRLKADHGAASKRESPDGAEKKAECNVSIKKNFPDYGAKEQKRIDSGGKSECQICLKSSSFDLSAENDLSVCCRCASSNCRNGQESALARIPSGVAIECEQAAIEDVTICSGAMEDQEASGMDVERSECDPLSISNDEPSSPRCCSGGE